MLTVIVWRDQAEHAAEFLSKGSRVVVMGRLQQRSWIAEDGSARSIVEVLAEELGPSLRWPTATPVRSHRAAANSVACGCCPHPPIEHDRQPRRDQHHE